MEPTQEMRELVNTLVTKVTLYGSRPREESYDAGMAAKDALLDAIASLEADKVRVDTAQALLAGFDAEWGADDEKIPVVVLELPKGVRIGMDFRKFLDDAKSAMSTSTPDLSFVKSDPSIGLEPITE